MRFMGCRVESPFQFGQFFRSGFFQRSLRRMAFFVPCAVMALLDLVFIVCSDLFDRILRHEGQGVFQPLPVFINQDEFVVFDYSVFHGWLPSAYKKNKECELACQELT